MGNIKLSHRNFKEFEIYLEYFPNFNAHQKLTILVSVLLEINLLRRRPRKNCLPLKITEPLYA
jgi:hypothetical protein